MERIGIAASKMAKGNLLFYNVWVVVISFLFSFFIFFIGGSAIAVALMVMTISAKGTMPVNFEKEWISIGLICMISLAAVVGIFCLIAVSRNLKFHK